MIEKIYASFLRLISEYLLSLLQEMKEINKLSTFMMPFQLSPVETWKSVRKAIPKFSKVACRLIPSQG